MNAEYRGDATVVVAGEPRLHRFKITVVAEDVMVLWFEDRTSKTQWQTRELEKTDFVTEENAIPMAKLTDYAKRFAECLSGESGSGIAVEWVVDSGSAPTLKLVLPLQWSSYVATVHFLFRMEQVDLKPVDLVVARLSDVEETQQDLKRQVADLQDMVTNPEGNGKSLLDLIREVRLGMAVAQRGYGATTNTASKAGEVLVWCGDLPGCVSQPLEFCDDGLIRLRVAGIYAVAAGISHTSTGGGMTCQLWHNGKKVFYTTDKATVAAPQVLSTMNYMVDAKKDDTLKFVFTGNNEASRGSYVTIWHLQ